MTTPASTPPPLVLRGAPSPLRAWLFLGWWSFWRHVRVGFLIWISLGLVALNAISLGLVVYFVGLGSDFPTALGTFSSIWIYHILLHFLVPICTLSFAISAIGGEREARTMPWLLTRPLSRPAIYLAKFVAVLPWCLFLTMTAFGVTCLVAGQPGLLALELYWPAIFWGTIAYSALFHLLGAWFRRPAIVGIVYTFFVESFLGNMPGTMKRASICYYCACLLDEPARSQGIDLLGDRSIFLPVSGAWALGILLTITVSLLILGAIVFSRLEYREET